MFNFDFLDKGLGIAFQQICSLRYILLAQQISLPDCLLEILGNMRIVIVC